MAHKKMSYKKKTIGSRAKKMSGFGASKAGGKSGGKAMSYKKGMSYKKK